MSWSTVSRALLLELVIFGMHASVPTATAAQLAVSVSADTSYFSPGVPFAADVYLPPISDLGSYNIDLLLTGSSGIAGTDFYFDVPATIPATARYVFTSSTNFLGAANTESAHVQRLTLSDFQVTGVEVSAGVNDAIAKVIVGTSKDFTGQLSLSIDSAGLLLDTPAITPTSVAGFDEIVVRTANQEAVGFSIIPEPTSFTLLVLGLAIISGARYGTQRPRVN